MKKIIAMLVLVSMTFGLFAEGKPTNNPDNKVVVQQQGNMTMYLSDSKNTKPEPDATPTVLTVLGTVLAVFVTVGFIQNKFVKAPAPEKQKGSISIGF